MNLDQNEILDDLLSRWHHWCKTDKLVPQSTKDPMFSQVNSPRHWQTTDEISDEIVFSSTMKAVDFHIWEIQDPFRSALHILARNCYTGKSVWMSPRLPADPLERGEIIAQARMMLSMRLAGAGVI